MFLRDFWSKTFPMTDSDGEREKEKSGKEN